MPTTEAAIRTTILADLYVVIGDGDGQGGWTVRVYHEPLVPWIWLGCLLMVAGGLTSLSDRRLRIGAPHRKHRSEEHTSELQSLMRISYAVFCLKKKNKQINYYTT